MGPRIDVDGVSKRYVKFDDTPLLATHALRWRTRTQRSSLWALRDIDLQVGASECVGIVGHNGSGKSTLLRLVSGVTAPTVGRVRVRGRIAPLLSVGVGFHPELTGRENVFLNAIVLGVPRTEIERRFDEIVDFAEIDEFIDTPVKFYSTGMFMRLGFAVSVLSDPDILLVDEVLSVGDLAFQIKCMDRMEQIKRAGTSLVFVSHNLAAIRRLCDRLVVLHEGRVRHDGDTATGGAVLHELLETQHSTDDTAPLLDIATCQLTDGGGRAVRVVPTGGEVRFAVTARLRETTPEIVVGALIYDEQGVYVFGETRRLPTETVQMGEQVSFEVSFLAELVGGTYSARLFFASANGASVTWVSQPLAVDGRADVEGIADLHARFSLRHGLDADGDPGPAQQAASTD